MADNADYAVQAVRRLGRPSGICFNGHDNQPSPSEITRTPRSRRLRSSYPFRPGFRMSGMTGLYRINNRENQTVDITDEMSDILTTAKNTRRNPRRGDPTIPGGQAVGIGTENPRVPEEGSFARFFRISITGKLIFRKNSRFAGLFDKLRRDCEGIRLGRRARVPTNTVSGAPFYRLAETCTRRRAPTVRRGASACRTRRAPKTIF